MNIQPHVNHSLIRAKKNLRSTPSERAHATAEKVLFGFILLIILYCLAQCDIRYKIYMFVPKVIDLYLGLFSFVC